MDDIKTINKLRFNNPNSGLIDTNWINKNFNFRFSENHVPEAITVSNYDNTTITLNRYGNINIAGRFTLNGAQNSFFEQKSTTTWGGTPVNATGKIEYFNNTWQFSASIESQALARFRYGPTSIAYIATNGNYVSGSSDIRFKTLLSKPTIGLSEINALTVTWFKYNELAAFHGFNPSTEQFGLIAQEVQNIYHNAVEVVENNHTDSPEVDDKKIDYLTIMYDKLIPLVIAAIQELSEKIDKLENMLNTQQ
ncbi:tail fiber domain-containing protein [Limnospira platensis]|uniref:tail fiber domain-containing protein n=1 Tax=Limnospira platensis TaxID=118562 RepID=UPI00396C7F30